MLDKNGKELKTGQIVKIEGGYFKSDNGTFVIKHSPNDPNWSGNDYSIYKCNKKGVESTSKHACAFYPLWATTNSREKRILAREHNKLNATIEVIGEAKTYTVKVIQKIGWKEYEHESIRIVLQKEYDELLSDKYCKVELINKKSAELSYK